LARIFGPDPSYEPDWDDLESDLEVEEEIEPETTPTISCRHCGREIYEDSFQCWYCGQYVEADTNPWSGKPVWWIFIAFAGIVALILALLLGL